ncbi:MAG: hypothetical protein SGARI_000027 [Bacillariaceae sp.]
MEAYFLLDLQGRPDLLTEEDVLAMETAFVNSYNVQSSACLVMRNATIFQTDLFSSGTSGETPVTDPNDGLVLEQRQFTNNSNIVESEDPVFSVIVFVQGNCNQCQSEEGAVFFRPYTQEELAAEQAGVVAPAEQGDEFNDLNRNLQTQNITLSDPCACPVPFDELFVQQYRDALVFTSAVDKVVNAFGITEMNVTNPECETTADDVFETTVLVTLDFNTNQGGQDVVVPAELTAQQRAELERLFIESYHETNLLNKDICDPFRRRIELMSLSPDNGLLDASLIPGFDFDGNYLNILLTVRGLCKDCPADTVLFDQIDVGADGYGIPFFRELQQTLECLCPIEGAASRSCNVNEFFEQYATAIEFFLPFSTSLVSVYELDPTFCPNDVTPFTTNVLLEVEVCPEGTFAGDLLLIQDAFVTTYNSLSMLYCDPNFRVLQSATVIDQEQVTKGGRDVLRLELTVTGTCQNGCDPATIRVYDFPIPDAVNGRSLNEDQDLEMVDLERRLQEVENCYCAADPIGSRAPSEAEFVRALENYVSTTIDDQLNCVSDIEECQFGDAFESVLILSFQNVDLTTEQQEEAFKSQLETSVLSSLESFYETNDQECPLDVRLIESVEAVLDIVVVTPPREESSRRQRLLQASDNTTVPDGGSNTTSSSPSSSPTFSGGSTQDLNAAVFVSGLCDGCESSSLLVNDVSSRRRILEESSSRISQRTLQETAEAQSYCYCPIGSVVVDEDPTFSRFDESVQEGLEQLGSTAVLVDTSESDPEDCELGEATCLSGLQSFECFDGGQFTVEVVVDLQFACDTVPVPDDPLFDEYDRIASEYVERYNTLQNDFCDTQQKVLTSAEVVQVGQISAAGEVAVVLSLSGTCTNCNGGANVDVYEFPPAPTIEATLQRRLRKQQRSPFVNSRNLQNGQDGLCVCTALGISDDGFTEAEFTDAFRTGVESLGLQCFVSCGPCDFGTSFTSSLVTRVASGSVVDTEALQTEFLSLLRDTFTSSDDICNPDNPLFVDATAQLEFVWNGRVIVNDGSARKLEQEHSRLLQTATPVTESVAPSTAPTFAIDPAGNDTLVLLTVAGVCDGCETGFTLTNDVVRRLKGVKQRQRIRQLQEQTQGECACVPGSEFVPEVSGTEFFDEITTVEIEDFETLVNIDCNAEEASLAGKTVSVQFRANGAISEAEYQAELNRLAVYLANAYEEATNKVCDIFFCAECV